MTRDDVVTKALESFDGGWSCAESVFIAGCTYLGVESDLVPKISTVFGGGLSRTKSICGALTGAAMVLSIKYGRTVPSDDRSTIVKTTQELVSWFRSEFGHDNCFELTGVDFNTPEGAADYKNRVHHHVCTDLVKKTVEKMVDILG